VTYQWAPDAARRVYSDAVRGYSVTFPVNCSSRLDPESSSYYLLYFSSHRRSVVAYSHPLKVSLLHCLLTPPPAAGAAATTTLAFCSSCF